MRKYITFSAIILLIAVSAFADITPNWNLDAPQSFKSAAITNYQIPVVNVMEITTAAPHNFTIGEQVRTVTGNSFVDGSLYYTYQTITAVPTATTFRVAKTSTLIPLTAIGGTAYVDWLDTNFLNRGMCYNDATGHVLVSRGVAGQAGVHAVNFDGTDVGELKMGADVNNKALTTNVATITTVQSHGLSVGQIVYVKLSPPDPVFDGNYTVIPAVNTVTQKALTANVATLTFATTVAWGAGQPITVALVPADPVFDGAYVIIAATATTVTYAKVNADVAATPSGGTVTNTVASLTATTFSYLKTNANVAGAGTGGALNIVPSGYTYGIVKIRAVCGSIFACSMTINTQSLTDVFTIYRWDTESAVPTVIFRNNTSSAATPPVFNIGPRLPATALATIRLGDTFDVQALNPASATSPIEIYTLRPLQGAAGPLAGFYKFAYTNGAAAVSGASETLLTGASVSNVSANAGCINVDGYGGDVYLSTSSETAKYNNDGTGRSSTILSTGNSAYQNSGVVIANSAGKLFKAGAERLFVYCDPAAIGHPDVNAYYNRFAIADVAAGMDKAKFLDAITLPPTLLRPNTNGTSDVDFDNQTSRPRRFFGMTSNHRLGSYTIPTFPTSPVTKKWIGGTDSSWFTGANWNPASVPTTIDDVTLDHSTVAGAYTVQISGVRQAVCRTLTIDGANTNKITLLLSSIGDTCGAPYMANGTGLNDISVSGNYTLPVTTRDESNKPRFLVAVLKGTVPVSTKAVPAVNVARISFPLAHNFEPGDLVVVTLNPADVVFDGVQTVTTVNNTAAPFWFEYAVVSPIVAATATAGTVKPNGPDSFVWNNISSATSFAQGGVGRVTTKALTANVATITYSGTTIAPAAGHIVVVALNPPDPVFDGTYPATGGSAATVTYAKVNANIAATQCGGRVVDNNSRANWYEYDGAITAAGAVPGIPLGTLMTGGAQALDCGISVTFGATIGHNTGDYWLFNPKGSGNSLLISGEGTTAYDLVVQNDGWIENRTSTRYTEGRAGGMINNWGGGNTGFIGPGGGYIHGTFLAFNHTMPSDQLDLGYGATPNTRKLDGAVTWDPASFYVTDIFDGPANFPSLYRSHVFGNVICRNSWTGIRSSIPYTNTGNGTYFTCNDFTCEPGTTWLGQTSISGGINYTVTIQGNIINQGTGDLQWDGTATTFIGVKFDGNGKSVSSPGGGTVTFPTGLTVNAGKDVTFNMPFTLTKAATVNGTLNLSAGNTFTVNTVTPGYGIIAKTGGTVNCAADTIPGTGNVDIQSGSTVNIKNAGGIDGQFTVAGTKSYSAGANYVYSGAVAQVTGASLPAVIPGLKVDNPTSLSLTNSVEVTSALDLTQGEVVPGANTIKVSGPSVSAEGAVTSTGGFVRGVLERKVVGNLLTARLFPVGTRSKYAPVTYTLTSAASTSGTLKAETADGDLAGVPDADKALDRYWTLTPSVLTGGTADLIFQYVDSDITGSVVEATLKAVRDTGSGLQAFNTQTTINTGANTATVTGVSALSPWSLINTTPDIALSAPLGDDWGYVLVGQSGPAKTLRISNTGLGMLNVTSITAAGDADITFVDPGAFSLDQNESQDVTVNFSPGSTGAKSKTITVHSNVPDAGKTFIGAGSNVVATNPVDFGFAKILSAGGTGKAANLQIDNNGAVPTTYTLSIAPTDEFSTTTASVVFVGAFSSATIGLKYLPKQVDDDSIAYHLASEALGAPDLDGLLIGRGWSAIEGNKMTVVGAAGATVQVGAAGSYLLSKLVIPAGAFSGSVIVTIQEPTDQHSKPNAVQVKFSAPTTMSTPATLYIQYMTADEDPPASFLAVAKWVASAWSIIGTGSADNPSGGTKTLGISSFIASDLFATKNTKTEVMDWMLVK